MIPEENRTLIVMLMERIDRLEKSHRQLAWTVRFNALSEEARHGIAGAYDEGVKMTDIAIAAGVMEWPPIVAASDEENGADR